MGFEEEVLELVSEVPEGKVTTYKKIAEALERPKAYRAVGNALAKNPNPSDIPCYKVVKSNGEIGDYSGGSSRKAKLLKAEGIEVKSGKINLDEYLFEDF